MLRTRLHTRLLGLLLAAAFVGAFSSPASAGTYDVYSCGKSGYGSQTGWNYEATAGSTGLDTYFVSSTYCDAYGWYRRFQNTMVPGGSASMWTFFAPADTYIQSATLYQTINYRAPGAVDNVYAERADGSRVTLSSVVGTGDVNAYQGNASFTMPSSGPPTVALRTVLGCQPANNCNPQWGGYWGNEWTLLGTIMTLVDPTTPSITSVGGNGWAAAPPSGVDAVTYTVADTGSGISEVRLLVDGAQVASNASRCTISIPVPCPLTDSGQLALDTTQLSEGQHTISLVPVDYSGNALESSVKQLAITVRRPPVASGGNPVSTTDPSANGGGSPAVGDQLQGNVGGWTGDGITYTYQWQRCDAQGLNCVPIDGATSLGYTPVVGDIGHRLQLCVTAANSGGSATSCSAPTPVVIAARTPNATPNSVSDTATPVGSPVAVAGAGRGAANGSPASDRVVLTAFTNNRSSSQKVGFGKRVPISGRLVGPNGTPVAGAVLSVQSQTALPGAAMADLTQVVTDANGRFSYVAPAGPSRVVRFAYRAYTADSAFADTTDIHLLVTAGVTMKATPKKVHNRHATVFTGRLLGKPLPNRGIVVDLQVFFRNQWRTFAAPRTNKQGVYRFKYRFMAGAATWRFRARVRQVQEYPYTIGYSAKPVKVQVLKGL